VLFHIVQGDKDIYLSPIEAVSKIFKHLKIISEAFIGVVVNKAVINIPSHLSTFGKEQIIEAAKIAGIDVVQLIKNPIAVCLAYEYDVNSSIINDSLDFPVPEKMILIIDFGHRLKVSIVSINNGLFYILKDEEVENILSDDIDGILFELFAGEFKKKTGLDVKKYKRSKLKLLNECEKLKRNLSRSQQLKLQIEGLAEGMDYSTTMSRARFEDLSDDFFRKVINFISSFIGDTPKENFEDIILIGGTCHIPRLKQSITNFFEKEPIANLNPEETISIGTAIASKCFERDLNLNKILTLKKTSLPIGLESQDGKFVVMIPKNTPIPVKTSKTFTNTIDSQEFINIIIYEGENEIAKENHLLGQFTLPQEELEKTEEEGNKRSEQIRITFIINNKGNLTIKVSGTLATKSITFSLLDNTVKF